MTAFDEFWELYPRKIAKDAAKRKFEQRVKAGACVEKIMEGLRRLNENQPWGSDLKFCPHASTWLNQGRWDDEHTPSPKVADENTVRPLPQYLRNRAPRRQPMTQEERMKREEREILHAVLKAKGIDWREFPTDEYRQMLQDRIANRMKEAG